MMRTARNSFVSGLFSRIRFELRPASRMSKALRDLNLWTALRNLKMKEYICGHQMHSKIHSS